MSLGLEVGLDQLPAPPGNTGGTAWVGMHDVPSYGSHCRATPLPQGDALHGPPGDVLHGPPAPDGLLAGPPAGVVTVGPARPVSRQ